MPNAYHLICRTLLAPDIGRRPCQLPGGDASRPAKDYAAAARRRLAWTSTKYMNMQIYTKCHQRHRGSAFLAIIAWIEAANQRTFRID
jgi:hypothetical protein